jgi:hypothetical protein
VRKPSSFTIGFPHRPSGNPLNITASGSLNTPGNTLYADLNGEQKVLGGLGPGQQYFDTSVYSVPPTATLGSMTRNAGPDGPGFWQLDTSLFKRFHFTGRMFAEFRVDAFNVTNSVRWGNPNTTVGNVTFGTITGVSGNHAPRSLRFGGRFVF